MPELTEIKGVGPVLAKACAANGYNDVEKVAAAMLHDLAAVPGISEAKAKLVIAAAQDLLQNGSAPTVDASPIDAIPVETDTGKAEPEPAAAPAAKQKTKKLKADKKKKKEKKEKKAKKNKSKKKSKKS